MKLFEKHGIKNEAYWVPTDDTLKDNTLIYLVSHESQEAAEKNWKAFSADPEWIKVRDSSRSSGKILANRPEIPQLLVTHRLPLDEASRAFELAADRSAGVIKVVLEA